MPLSVDNKIGVLILLSVVMILTILFFIENVPDMLAKPNIKTVVLPNSKLATLTNITGVHASNLIVPSLAPPAPPQPPPISNLPISTVKVQALPGTVITGINPYNEIMCADTNIVGTVNKVDYTPNWTKISGTLSQVIVNGNGSLFGINKDGMLYYTPAYNATKLAWVLIPGKLLKYISFNGTGLCGVDFSGTVWYADQNIKGIGTPNWTNLGGNAYSVIINNNGSLYNINKVDYSVWYSDSNVPDKIKWVKFPNTYSSQLQYNGTTLLSIWKNVLYYAKENTKDKPNWAVVPLPNKLGAKNVHLNSDGSMYLITNDNVLWYGTNTYDSPGWSTVPGLMTQISSNK
jgi:hypothetical protein